MQSLQLKILKLEHKIDDLKREYKDRLIISVQELSQMENHHKKLIGQGKGNNEFKSRRKKKQRNIKSAAKQMQCNINYLEKELLYLKNK